jgi:GNAT superfamily N-acetyltransferase
LDGPVKALLSRLEAFYDAVPRRGADVEDHGPLRLFLPEPDAWPYYARPAEPGAVVRAADVKAVRGRQRDLGLPEAFEWVHELSPSLTEAAAEAGLVVRHCPLLVLDGVPADLPPGTAARVLGPDDDELALAEAVTSIGFGAGVTADGRPAGTRERDRAVHAVLPGRLERLRERIRDGSAARAVAGLAVGPGQGSGGTMDGAARADLRGPLSAGGYQRAGDVVEVVGIATLPVARRRGLGAAVAAVLSSAALDAGATTVFLSAQDDTVARVYERVGFRRVATAGIAEPPS